MSLTLLLKRISNLGGKYDRLVSITFRGYTYSARRPQCEYEAIINEEFTWPHYGKDITEEMLEIKVYNHSKIFSNRLLGYMRISLQQMTKTGRLILREALVDKNNSLTDILVDLEIRYQPVEGAVGTWTEDDYAIDMYEGSVIALTIKNNYVEERSTDLEKAEELDRKTRSLGRQLANDNDDEDEDDVDISEIDISSISFTPQKSRSRFFTKADLHTPRIQNFQIAVTITEARKLIGVNIDPVVYVKVGDEKKHTATQKSTNCPFYNEYFIFEFQEPAAVLFDKIIEIIVVHAKKIPFTGVQLGLFRIDAGTVYQQPDHGFYQKWAILTDPKDTKSGIKGFVKCTITVFGKGDSQGGIPGGIAKPDEDVEKNLLLPKQVPLERPWAKFYIKLYKAEDLPSMNSGFMGSISKILREQKVFIDPYIQVTFAGQQGETSVESNTTNPEWNEQITFVEMFPPLARRIKIQVIDDANINDVAIATHFINLQQISDPRINAGFYPTLGPTWVYLYGSPQNSVLRDAYKDLNEGLGEGVFYRGRILMAISVDIYSSIAAIQSDKGKKSKSMFKFKKKSKKSKSKSKAKEESHSQIEGEESTNALEQPSAMEVSVDSIHPLPESATREKEEFLLFAGFFEATMIDPSVQSRLLTFEVSIGNCGKLVEVVTKKKKEEKVEGSEEKKSLLDSRDSEDELENNEISLSPKDNSITPPRKADNTEYDRSYCCIPYLYEKPCVYIWSSWEDYSWRLYNSNVLAKIAERLEDGFDKLLHMARKPKTEQENFLCEVLNEFVAGCRQYHIYAEKKTMNRPNTLDRCRIKTLKCNVISHAKQALKIMKQKRKNLTERLNEVQKLMEKFKKQVEEPQTPIPDIFIWMLSNGKRVAVARVPARQVLYSVVEEENGKDCGKIQSIIMKAPGAPIGEIFAKLEIYMWLGVTKSTKSIMSHLPKEYLPVYDEEARKESPRMLPPIKLNSDYNTYFQLRAHMYQARGLLAADQTGLSDPFARVVFSTQCQSTRYMEETLSPMWCEMLLFDQILIEGSKDELKDDPPIIIINIFDFNSFGSPEFLGRAFAVPQIKLQEEKYKKPTLEFHDIYKGKTRGGELLAAFELIELDYSGYGEPSLPEDVESRNPEFLDVQEKHFIIPVTIRPTLKKFRIEVLFWGLRDLKRINLFEVEQPQVTMECGGQKVESEVIANYKENPNFTELAKYFEVDLPEDMNLHPPLSIVVLEQRAFGRTVLVGSYTVTSLQQFSLVELEQNPNPKETAAKSKRQASILPQQTASSQTSVNIEVDVSTDEMKKGPLLALMRPMKKLAPKPKSESEHEEFEEKIDLEELDWWSKYYASLEEMKNKENEEEEEEAADLDTEPPMPSTSDVDLNISREQQDTNTRTRSKKTIATFQIYSTELEKEYNNFQDWLYIFPLYRGKASEDEFGDNVDDRVMGKCKGSLLIYPSDEVESSFKILQGKPTNRPVKVLVRVYIVKATNLAPTDLNGKSDPYIVVKIGEQMQDSAERYIPKQLNPVFGEVFEMTVAFPVETELTVSIFDHDMVGKNDLIGETKLDLENRYYSRHRAQCGLPTQYDIEGYNAWRDCLKPTQILKKLCKDLQLPEPEYRPEEVKVSNKIFKIPIDLVPIGKIKKGEQPLLSEEQKALYVLNHWEDMPEHSFKMVPEHIEIRKLQKSDNPGMSQGQVHMWVDMFPVDLPAPPPVNIKPRQPISYEMRVIIWNTDDVPLDDVNPLTGARSSDIYIKGWLKGLENDKQETDVHFNSLTGEGNFNWRFVFRFDYLPTEKEIVYKKKESIFSLEESEFRQPAVLMLQLWDYDLISANDFLGSVELKLNDMVRPAKTADQCTIKMAKEKAGPHASIIRGKRMKGWWPMIKVKEAEDEEEEDDESKKKKKKKKKKKVKIEDVEFTDSSGNTYILRGKVEAEMHLLTVEEAEKSPVGLGRKEPEPLDKPNRPNTSFNWFINPLKSFVYFIWKNYKWYIIGLLVIAILALFIFLILYTMPQFISEKIING
ncbi:fer-1-like protein 4 isoform X1 [Mobula birostris]|uniref:fer-1-like protein 4 isoform X1 n=1 Tax=Mobula birostris TaxID=1983395 RepID=UPI003B28374B